MSNNKQLSNGLEPFLSKELLIVHQNIQSLKATQDQASNYTRLLSIINILESSFNEGKPIDFLLLTETWISDKNFLQNQFKFNQSRVIKENYHVITDHEENTIVNYHGKGTAIIMRKTWKPFIQKIHRFPGRP